MTVWVAGLSAAQHCGYKIGQNRPSNVRNGLSVGNEAKLHVDEILKEIE